MDRFVGNEEIRLKDLKPKVEIPPEMMKRGGGDKALFDRLKETQKENKELK